MNQELKINPEFEDIIPPMGKEEFEQLEKIIVKEGRMFSPIITWNGFVVDGHRRFRILQKHPEIEFTSFEKHFEDKYDAISWICQNQISTKRLAERYIRYLRAIQYDAEKNSCKFKGNQYTVAGESGGGKNCHHQKAPKTRAIVAEKIGVPECEIKQAQQLFDGINAAEEVLPGIAQEILTEKIYPTDKAIKEIAHIPQEQRRAAAEKLRENTDKRKMPKVKTNEDVAVDHLPTDKEADNVPSVNEDDILNSLKGAVDDLIDLCNNYFTRFPKLLADEQYQKKTIATLKEFQTYISKIERK